MVEAVSVQEASTRLAGIIWGAAKTGKTTWACSLPGRKLIINFDPDGFITVAHRNDVDIIDLSQLAAIDAIKQAQKIGAFILENADKYESVIVDSLTTLTDIALEDAVIRGVGKSPKFTPTIDAPGLTGYGARNNTVNGVIDKILRATAQKKLNCFFIAHEDDAEMSDDGKTLVQQTIMLSAKIRNKAGLKVSEIYHITANNGKRTVYTAPFGIKKPMGSRMFDMNAVGRFTLDYDFNIADEEQPTSLVNIIKAWKANGHKKMTSVPK